MSSPTGRASSSDGGPGPGQAPDQACAAAAAGVARAACYLDAVTSRVQTISVESAADRRMLKRLAHGAAVARKRVLRLEKKTPPPARRVATARKAIVGVVGSIDKAESKGRLGASDAAALTTLATAATGELDAL